MKVHPCPRSHNQEIVAAAGAVLCAPCIRQVQRNLRVLPALHQESLHNVSPTSRRMNPTKVSGSRNRDHLNISVLDARQDILAILESWSGIVVENIGGMVPERSVAELTRFLAANLEWLAAQPPAAGFADEIERTTAELRRIIDPDPGGPRTPVRNCVVDNCTGTIAASPQRAGDTGGSSIRCSAGHTWEMHEWLTLRRLMERQKKSFGA